jgi:Aspartyl protease
MMAFLFKIGWLAGITVLTYAAAPPASVKTAEEYHRFKLTSFATPTSALPLGLLIAARVNDGPMLHLLLDSGARYLVLDKKTAARSGCVGGTALDLVGAGGASPKAATTVRAGTVEVSGLVLRDVDIAIVEGRVLDGVDGVLPLALFKNHFIRLNVPAKTLELSAYPIEAVSDASAILRNGLLFVKGSLNDVHEGYFLLDTGSSYNAISTSVAQRMNAATGFSRVLSVQSGVARMDAEIVPGIMRFRVAANELRSDPVLAVDLSTASRYLNLEVSGLLGYPALRNSIVTVNYRAGTVHFETKR